jgi:hypothetical protein
MEQDTTLRVLVTVVFVVMVMALVYLVSMVSHPLQCKEYKARAHLLTAPVHLT